MTADALGIGLATVNRVMANYRKDPDSLNAPPQLRGRPTYSVDVSHQEAVRAYIRQANLEGRYITLETIRSFLQEKSPSESFPLSTLARTLDRWGFEFGKGTRTQHLKEKDYIVVARQHYLRRMRQNRMAIGNRLIRPEVYLDESYVNKNHSKDFVWYSSEDGPWIQKPTGKGERLIIMNAMTKDGWVPEAKVVFKSTRKTGDYHGQMNGDLFQKWFVEKLLPNIPSASLIIMDNAKYHNVLTDDTFPTLRSYKYELQTWLANNYPQLNLHNDPSMLKPELYEICKKLAPPPSFKIDSVAEEQGHRVLRTPPYHCELQPIESCWGVVKNHCRDHCEFTMASLHKHLRIGFSRVTPSTCQKLIAKVGQQEDAFWVEDAEVDDREMIEETILDSAENYMGAEEHDFG